MLVAAGAPAPRSPLSGGGRPDPFAEWRTVGLRPKGRRRGAKPPAERSTTDGHHRHRRRADPAAGDPEPEPGRPGLAPAPVEPGRAGRARDRLHVPADGDRHPVRPPLRREDGFQPDPAPEAPDRRAPVRHRLPGTGHPGARAPWDAGLAGPGAERRRHRLRHGLAPRADRRLRRPPGGPRDQLLPGHPAGLPLDPARHRHRGDDRPRAPQLAPGDQPGLDPDLRPDRAEPPCSSCGSRSS